MSAAFSAIMMTAAFGSLDTIRGMMDASITRSFFTPRTLQQQTVGLGRLRENPIVDSIGQNNRPMR